MGGNKQIWTRELIEELLEHLSNFNSSQKLEAISTFRGGMFSEDSISKALTRYANGATLFQVLRANDALGEDDQAWEQWLADDAP